MIAVLLLLLVSVVGTIGLHYSPPRPRAQENWAIIAITPIFILLMFALVNGVWHG